VDGTRRHPHLLAVAGACWALVGAGCALNAAGPGFEESKPAGTPADRALVFVYRFHAEPTAMPASVSVDGVEVADLYQSGYTWFYATPGTRRIKASWGLLSGQSPARITIDLQPGQTYYLELVGVSRLTGATGDSAYGEYVFQAGSGLNALYREAAEPMLTACHFQRPRATSY
jgi:hypothetical protein